MSWLEVINSVNSNIWFDAGAKLASFVGVLLTFYAVYKIKGIRRAFVAKATLPDLQEHLRQHVSKIISYLNEFDSQWEFLLEELARCSATLKAISRVAPRPVRSDSKKVLREIRKLANSKADPSERETETRNVYLLLVELELSISYRINEIRWEP